MFKTGWETIVAALYAQVLYIAVKNLNKKERKKTYSLLEFLLMYSITRQRLKYDPYIVLLKAYVNQTVQISPF